MFACFFVGIFLGGREGAVFFFKGGGEQKEDKTYMVLDFLRKS